MVATRRRSGPLCGWRNIHAIDMPNQTRWPQVCLLAVQTQGLDDSRCRSVTIPVPHAIGVNRFLEFADLKL